jgi:chromosome partitioning protein
MGRVVAVALQKGGVGKTTTVVSLAHIIATKGKKVLLIDLDPQANASQWLDAVAPNGRGVLACIDGQPVRKEIVSLPVGLDLLAANRALTVAEITLISKLAREHILRKALEPVLDEYDYILVDTQPSLGVLTLNALTAAHDLIVPVECKSLSLNGIVDLQEVVELVRASTNPGLRIMGYVATRVGRNKLSDDVARELRKAFGEQVFRTVVRENVRLGEAPSAHKPILMYDHRSSGAEDYNALAREVLERLEG